MQLGRGMALVAALLAGANAMQAQDGSADADARSKLLSERMRISLEQQSRVLSQMQRDLERASRSDSRVRDSIVRATSQQISELAREIARVQMEADRAQMRAVAENTRAQLRVQIASARAMADVTRSLADQQRKLTFSTRSLPRGYLGVVLSGTQPTELRDGKVYTVFVSPVLVESVEPGSPAAEGGLEAGDTIVAFGKSSVPGAVPLGDLLTPGERVPFKVRRDGKERALTVTIGTRQVYTYSSTTASADGNSFTTHVCAGDDCPMTFSWPRTPRSPDAPVAARSPNAPATPLAPLPPQRATGWSASDYEIAGAVMTTITDDLEELTGVDEGILVLRVAPGTPAAASGLRGGDVILRVNDDDCEGVRDLQMAVQRASSRGARKVVLVVSRKQKETTLSLQW